MFTASPSVRMGKPWPPAAAATTVLFCGMSASIHGRNALAASPTATRPVKSGRSFWRTSHTANLAPTCPEEPRAHGKGESNHRQKGEFIALRLHQFLNILMVSFSSHCSGMEAVHFYTVELFGKLEPKATMPISIRRLLGLSLNPIGQ